MNNLEDFMQVIYFGLVVSTFLLNTGRALKAIELCKESLILLSNKALRVEEQIVKIIYGAIYQTMFNAYHRISDNTNAITYGRKVLTIYRECGDTVREGLISSELMRIYYSQNMYVEAKELCERAIIAMREIGDREGEAVCYRNLGTASQSLGEFVKAKDYQEKALAITVEIGDREGEAACYDNLGIVFKSLREYDKAKDYHEKALAIFMEIGDRAGDAACNENLGTLFVSLSEYVKAKEYLEKALTIFMEIGDREREATCYGNLGNVFIYLSEYGNAKECLEKTLAINMEIGDREGEATCYDNLGTVFKSLSEYDKAKDYHEKALAISMEIGDRVGEATCYNNLGTVFKSLSEYDKAKDYHEKALAINMETGDREGQATCYDNLGTVFKSLGEYVKAKDYHEKALAISVEIGDRAGEAACYNNLGTVFKSLAEFVKAKKYLEKALPMIRKIGRREQARFYAQLAEVSLSLGKYGKTKEYLDEALATSTKIGDRANEALCYECLGDFHYELGDNLKAKEYHEKSLAIALEIGDKKRATSNYRTLGIINLALGEDAKAEECFERALSISENTFNVEYNCYCGLTLAKFSQDCPQEAISYLFRCIEKYEDLRGINAGSDQIKISLNDAYELPYWLLSRLFVGAGVHKNALYATELGRARALADLIANKYSADERSCIDICENVMKKESNCVLLYISYDCKEVLLWILKTSGAIYFRKVTVNEQTLHTRLAEVARNLGEFFAIMAESFRSFGILPEEVCEDRSLNDIEPKSGSCQKENIGTLREGKKTDDPKPSLNLFYEMLIKPVSDLLNEPEIIIVPDRVLYRVPFPALLDESGKYLSETFRIRVVPSLWTLKLIQDSPSDYHSQTGALVVGDPDVGVVIYRGSVNKKFVALPGARKEAEMIGRMLGAESLIGQQATKQAVLDRISSVSLIHIAAHGNAERGEIALSPLGSNTEIPQEDDYLLKVSDISQVQVRAKLVVLSCCHSGRGQIRAEGVVGIARAFLGSGARSVLVALWALEDRATEQFMSCFYEHLVRGVSVSESLHEAMKWMRDNDFIEVHEWAPFMLIGDNVSFTFPK